MPQAYPPKKTGVLKCKFLAEEFPLWFRLRIWYCRCEDAGSTPGLAQWLKEPAWLQVAARATSTAWISSCRG